MKKTKQTNTKLLVIAITAPAILTARTSITGAITTFANVNSNPDNTMCSGGASIITGGCNYDTTICVGGVSGHTTVSDGMITSSSGSALYVNGSPVVFKA